MNIYKLLVFLLISAISTTANAFEAGQVLQKVITAYQPLQGQWHAAILPFTYRLFWLLVLLDVTYSTMQNVIERKTFEDSFAWLTRKAITIVFFFTLIKSSGEWIPQIIDSFSLIGKTAGKVTNLTPDGIISYGYNLALALFYQLGELGTGDQIIFAIPVLFTAIFTLLGFAVVAGQLIIALIESYIVIGGGIIMLGFSGSKWTVDMATAYLKYAVGTGVKLMVAYLIIGAGLVVFKDLSVDPDQFINSVFALLAQVAVFVYLAWSIPSIASAIVSGAPSSTLGGLIGTAATAAAAVTGTASTIAGASKATVGGALGMGSKAADLGKNIGGGRSNSIESTGGKSNMPSSAIPDPNGPPPGGSESNASTASIGSSSVSPATQAKLDKAFPKNKDENEEKPKKPAGTPLHQKIKNAGGMVPNDQASVQVSGFNLTHGKE